MCASHLNPDLSSPSRLPLTQVQSSVVTDGAQAPSPTHRNTATEATELFTDLNLNASDDIFSRESFLRALDEEQRTAAASQVASALCLTLRSQEASAHTRTIALITLAVQVHFSRRPRQSSSALVQLVCVCIDLLLSAVHRRVTYTTRSTAVAAIARRQPGGAPF